MQTLMAKVCCFLFSIAVVFLVPFRCTSYSSAMATITNITTDEIALLSLKSNITFDPYDILAANWSSGSPICNWIGITCSRRHKRVAALHLANMGLVGSIPPSIGNLSFLVSLDLSNNNFHGHLPDELDRLQRLEGINLTDNGLYGQLPSSLCKCSKLQLMSLAFNKFSGSIPREIGDLTMLKQLYLGNNNLTGIIPPTLCNISKLELISLRDNNFTGDIPREIGNITLLKELYLEYNNFTGTIPETVGNLLNLVKINLGANSFIGDIPATIFNLSTLRGVGLAGNHFSGVLPSFIGQTLPNLEQLLLGGNELTGSLPVSITNASKLYKIDIISNHFSGIIPNSFGNLASLEELRLGDNNFIGEAFSRELSFVTSLTSCKKLKLLSFQLNPLNGTLPVSIGNLSSSLEQISAAGCGIKGAIPNEIGNLSGLTYLSLFANDLIGAIPMTVKGMQKLRALDLSSNKIQGSIPQVLCYLANLIILYLDVNELFGPVPTCLGNVTSLRYLYLGHNKLNSSMPASFGNLGNLLVFNMTSNSLVGFLPSEIASLKVITSIDVSFNHISGNIPSTNSGLQNLVKFSLAHNRLEGPIPDTLESLASLEILDLSHNNLSGMIPKSMIKLSHLRYFNVSFNSLSGEIPTGGPFQNFTSQSFVSNEALCGATRFGVPPCITRMVTRSKTSRKVVLLCVLSAVSLVVLVMTLVCVLIRHRKSKRAEHELDLQPTTLHRRISYHELLVATNGFSESNLLGSGSFGSVYRGVLSDGIVVAIKVFRLDQEKALKSFETECEVIRNIRHRNLTKVITSCSNLDFKAVVLKYMPNGSLEKWLYSHNYFLDIMQRLNIMIDVACALDYLHFGFETPVVHCDLKPSNVLLNEDMIGHVSDFGIAKLFGEREFITHTRTLGTVGYIAPEYGSEGSVSTWCDVYSYGIMLMEMLTRKTPTDDMFAGDMNLKRWVRESLPDRMTEVIDANLLGQESEHYSAKLECVSSIMVLALECSAESPDQRINMNDVLEKLKKIRVKLVSNLEAAES